METPSRRIFVRIAVAWFLVGALLLAAFILGGRAAEGAEAGVVGRALLAMYWPTGDLAARAYRFWPSSYPSLAQQDQSVQSALGMSVLFLAANSLLWAVVLTVVARVVRRLRRSSTPHRSPDPPLTD